MPQDSIGSRELLQFLLFPFDHYEKFEINFIFQNAKLWIINLFKYFHQFKFSLLSISSPLFPQSRFCLTKRPWKLEKWGFAGVLNILISFWQKIREIKRTLYLSRYCFIEILTLIWPFLHFSHEYFMSFANWVPIFSAKKRVRPGSNHKNLIPCLPIWFLRTKFILQCKIHSN